MRTGHQKLRSSKFGHVQGKRGWYSAASLRDQFAPVVGRCPPALLATSRSQSDCDTVAWRKHSAACREPCAGMESSGVIRKIRRGRAARSGTVAITVASRSRAAQAECSSMPLASLAPQPIPMDWVARRADSGRSCPGDVSSANLAIKCCEIRPNDGESP